MTGTGTEFDPGLAGRPCWLELRTGERIRLAVEDWSGGDADSGADRSAFGLPAFDRLLVSGCSGPTLDIGCGPGRLTAALAQRGVPALGVDTSALAVRLTLARGAAALRCNVFSPLPGEGRWAHALLADGNIGIGGNPAALLRRVRELLAPGGIALVEVSGAGLRGERVRLADGAGRSDWFDWAWVGADAIGALAAPVGLRLRRVIERDGRGLAELAA